MRPAEPVLTAATLHDAARRYRDYRAPSVSYATVRDYCDSFDHLRPLATMSGDLKDVQRPWALKAVLGAARGRRGRLLEIGAGQPVVADLLRRLGHEVWVVDPYDGSGNGPTEYRRLRALYPGLHLVPERFSPTTSLPAAGYFDCVYSISVLEHVPRSGLGEVFAGLRRFLHPDGITIHAVDHVLRGNGADEHLGGLRALCSGWGVPEPELDDVLRRLVRDTETYYLSAEGHNRWRGSTPYDEFPMRVCVSMQYCGPRPGAKEG
jgi:hypothetical protein